METRRKWIPLANEAPIKPKQNSEPDALKPTFKNWFNNPLLSDLVIHTSEEATAKKYYCHKFVLSCASEKLYKTLMTKKFEDKSGGDVDKDHVLIIEQLKDKDEYMINAFFGLLYDESLLQDQSLATQFEYVSDLYEEFDLKITKDEGGKHFNSAIRQNLAKFKPRLNGDSPLSDIKLYFNETKTISLKTHRIMLAYRKYLKSIKIGNIADPDLAFFSLYGIDTLNIRNSSYFGSFFSSGMKDSNTHEAMITLDLAEISPNFVAEKTEQLFALLYSSVRFEMLSLMDFDGETIVALNSLATKYLFDKVKQVTEYYINSFPSITYIDPAIKFDNQMALMASTKAVVENILSMDLTTLPVEYLQNIRSSNNQNLFHVIIENQFQPGSEPRLRQIKILEGKLGAQAQITLTDVDDNGNNSLHYACQQVESNKELVEYLISKQIDVNAMNKLKEQPLGIALASWMRISYVSAKVLLDNKKQRHEQNYMLDDDDDILRGKKIRDVFTGVDRLIMAGAKCDLAVDDNMINMLGYASSFTNSQSTASWKIIVSLLNEQPRDRVVQLLTKNNIELFIQEAYKRPIKYFFGKMNVSYQCQATTISKTGDKIVQIRVDNLTEIKIGSKILKLVGMKVVINCTEYLTRTNRLFKSNVSVTVSSPGSHRIKFKGQDEVVSLFSGLASVVNGNEAVSTISERA